LTPQTPGTPPPVSGGAQRRATHEPRSKTSPNPNLSPE
jgi:hypothetical protein